MKGNAKGIGLTAAPIKQAAESARVAADDLSAGLRLGNLRKATITHVMPQSGTKTAASFGSGKRG